MGEAIISASGTQFGLIINSEGRALVDLSGTSLFIGSVSANVDSIYVQSGIINIQEEKPTSLNRNNPAGSLVYNGDLLGSIVTFIGGSTFVNRLGYSGTNNVLVTIGSNYAI